MKPAATLALALLAACATPGAPREAARPRQDLVALSREMTAIDLAAARGGDELQAERQRRAQAAEAAPKDPTARFLAIYARPRGEERWAAFHALDREFPRSALGQVGMAGVYVEWRVLDQVDRAVAAALRLEPDGWLAVLHRAQAQEKRERPDLAAADFRAVLGFDPANPEAHLGLARLARAQGDAAAAAREAEAALGAVRHHVGALTLLAELALESGDRAAAAARWADVVEASPRDRAARFTLAKLHRAAGNPALARDQLRAAVALKEDAEGLAALADAARAANDAATELQATERLSLLDPSAGEWRRVAELRLAAGDWGGAEKALRRSLARDPRDPFANAGLGRVHLHRGESQEAVAALRAGGDAGKADLAALERRLNLDRISRPDLGQLQRAVQALVDRTYRARAAEVPSLSGVIRVRVTVGASGEATLVEVLEDSIHDPDVRACAYWNLRDASYPPKKPGRFTFAFSFRR
jgi:tetratricopeptide (TPR) repeat protein